jgi:glucose-6-phosphate dehydrogenase assembly protein OpcA
VTSRPERTEWRGKGVHVDQVTNQLARLHRDHQRDGHVHALTRTLNLIITPSSARANRAIEEALAGLGSHSPSRTLVLRRHDRERLDAELIIECELPEASGRVGVCHDQVTLTADDVRLGHSASLLAPLLLSDLPTVLWLTEPSSQIPDPRLLERAQQVLVDSASEGASFRRLVELARGARVHDLTWGRLEFWRAAVAAAFEPPERRLLLPRISSVEIAYCGDALSAAYLLAGWVTARAGWRPGTIERDNGRAAGRVSRPDGGAVTLALKRDPGAPGCGGVEALTLRAGSEEIHLSRGAATNRLRDLFAEALQPLPSFARGYLDALTTAAAMLGGGAEATS